MKFAVVRKDCGTVVAMGEGDVWPSVDPALAEVIELASGENVTTAMVRTPRGFREARRWKQAALLLECDGTAQVIDGLPRAQWVVLRATGRALPLHERLRSDDAGRLPLPALPPGQYEIALTGGRRGLWGRISVAGAAPWQPGHTDWLGLAPESLAEALHDPAALRAAVAFMIETMRGAR